MSFRTVPPPYTTDFSISLEPLLCLPGNTRTGLLRSDKLEVFRLELIFHFGLLHAPDIQTGYFLSRLISHGTRRHTAVQITEGFEKLGGFLDITTGLHRTVVTLHGLSRYFKEYLPLLEDILLHPLFPQEEIDIQQSQSLQMYQVENQKPAFRANTIFKEVMYGANTLAGQTPDIRAISSLNRDSLLRFHADTFVESTFDIYLCGFFTDTDISALADFSALFSKNITLPEGHFPEKKGITYRKEEMENSVQSSLIIGKRLFNRRHPDFFPFLVTNTVFGGYFGSRLMKNIREEKGLTYGISSSLITNGPDGLFSIRAELNKEKLDEALAAIETEKEILCTTPVSHDELTTVKNYIKGNILNGTNTLFDIMDKHKAVYYEALPPDFYETMSTHIDEVDAEEVMRIAHTWLNDFSTVIAG